MDHGAVVLPRSIRAERAGDSLSGRGRCGDRFRSRIERLRPFRPGTVHGVRIGPRLFVGLGVAWNYYSARGDMPDDSFREYTDGGRSFVPIFADMKVYFLDRRISPYLKVDIGYGIHKHGGIYAAPAVGVKFGLGSVLALNIDFGFQVQQQTAPDTSSGLGGIVLRAGLSF